jgi:periplasmic protein TonB
VVGTDGVAHEVRVTISLGPGFDEEALKAVRQWTFQPATMKGNPTPALLRVHIVFRNM